MVMGFKVLKYQLGGESTVSGLAEGSEWDVAGVYGVSTYILELAEIGTWAQGPYRA